MKKYEELFLTTTDTITGIGSPISGENKELIYEIKERPKHKQIAIVVGSIEQARTFDDFTPEVEERISQYLPGPVTLVFSPELGIKFPGEGKFKEFVKENGPFYLTSANKSGMPQLPFEQAIAQFPEIKKHFNFGDNSTNKPSTIIEVSTGKILRE